LVAENEYGCTDTSMINTLSRVIVNPKPTVGFALKDSLLNPPFTTIDITNLSKPGYKEYNWYFDQNDPTNNKQQTEFVKNFPYTYDDSKYYDGKFKITQEVIAQNANGRCKDTISKWIIIKPPLPDTRIGNKTVKGCAPLTVKFENATKYATKYKWEFGNGAISSDKNPTYTYYEPGTYIVALEATGPGGTWKIKHDTVVVYETPIAFFEVYPDSIMLPNQPVHAYNLAENAASVEWDFGDGSAKIYNDDTVHYYTKPGRYSVTLKVKSEYGCKDSIRIDNSVFVEEGGIIKFPNAFTPNVNGPNGGYFSYGKYTNDVFYPLHRGVLKYKLMIFNRLGEEIFESDDPDIGWDGYYNSRLVPQDVYVWKAEGVFNNGETFQKTGTITVVR
jgi:gliding motility-associated-like protein